MTKLVAISGRKGSGKTTVANAFASRFDKFHSLDDYNATENMAFKLYSCKCFNFADSLKVFCRDYLNIDEKLWLGEESLKDTLVSHILWENMPHHSDLVYDNNKEVMVAKMQKYYGPMSVRQILQQMGTEVGRRIWPDIWLNACFKSIERENPGIAVIGDCRFRSEADAVKARGGIVVRLTRKVKEDTHSSETDLDNYNFDVVVDNAKLSKEETIAEFNQKVLELI